VILYNEPLISSPDVADKATVTSEPYKFPSSPLIVAVTSKLKPEVGLNVEEVNTIDPIELATEKLIDIPDTFPVDEAIILNIP
jgi:hypothetical protein